MKTPSKREVDLFLNACCDAWSIYQHYRQLFEHSLDRSRFLHQVAPAFFTDLNTMFVETLILYICRLTDPATTRGASNLTAQHFVDDYDWNGPDRGELRDRLAGLNEFRNYVLDARNKIVAHADLETALRNKELGGFPAGRERRFWDDLKRFAEILHASTSEGPLTIFEVHIVGTADDVVRQLEAAHDADKCR